MTTLIKQAADIYRRLADPNDDVTHSIITSKETVSDYNFFIHAFEAQIKFYSDMIYRLKQERDEQ